ncbi:MAG: DUF5054 domain-containing protein [Spirochaetales bacterium]|nr:DUF5054 domain-containing protein [Spirochaetales bacterium]
MKQNNEDKQTIHIVFKSHLDIGFTDLAENVVKQYIREYIPKALDLIDRLHESPIGFTWTTGSWMIREFLERADSSLRRRMEEAIKERTIRWHALPFTLHSELASAELFEAGLQISRDLDQEFGVRTIAGKFTDVPGHTRAIIPLLARYGIKFLHIGTNPACIPADVPPLFRWRSPDGSEVIVNYQTGYGNCTDFPPAEAVLWFSHQQDNEQPPSIDKLNELYAHIRADYPDAYISSSSLDNFASQILPFSKDLPVVDQEIGDTWIHGAGTDPLKVSRYRALCRFISSQKDKDLCSNELLQLKSMKQKLLLVPEHTWGMDLKRYLPDYLNYRKADFYKARAQNSIPLSVKREGERNYLLPQETENGSAGLTETYSYKAFESSWKEQRDFIDKSLTALKSPKLRKEADAALQKVEPYWITIEQTYQEAYKKVPITRPISFGPWICMFSPETGALTSALNRDLGCELCREGGALGLYRYEIYSDREYQSFYTSYLLKGGNHHQWSLQDYTKPGLSRLHDLQHTIYHPQKPIAFLLDADDAFEVRIYGRMPREASEEFGAPREVLTRYMFNKIDNELTVMYHWHKKDANRIPESSWLEFDLAAGEHTTCILDKMGQAVSPLDIVKNGNRALHAVDSGVTFSTDELEIRLLTQDAPLVSIGRPRILEFDQHPASCREGVFFNLHNNLWGTNFPMWYEDDGMFSFTLQIRRKS